MLDISKGKYWEKALSLIEGCTPVSEACDSCWLAQDSFMRQLNPNEKISKANAGLTIKRVGGPACFSGVVRVRPDRLDIPLKRKKPTVFAVWSDLFHEAVPDSFIAKAFNVMRHCEQHTFLVLTKRPEKLNSVAKYSVHFKQPIEILPDNIWLGVTAENQEQADKRIPILLQVPAAKRFVSIEPMLGAINLEPCDICGSFPVVEGQNCIDAESLDLVILGGESGHKRREMKLEWAENVVGQCKSAGVPVFVKQLHIKGKLVKEMSEFPEHLRIRELPWRVK